MSDHRLHLICNAHLDPVWLWEWEEGAAEAISTFRVAADLCEEFCARGRAPGFVFNHNEAVLYEWVEEYEPALFKRIQRLVKQGKWHIMGGWFLQPDCNMPSGESFVRQALYGRRYFRDKFGVRPTTALNFDPFGHSVGLPQILAKSGYDSYLFCRPGQEDCPLPAAQFEWVGCDGSSVRAVRMVHYNSPLGQARQKVENLAPQQPADKPGLIPWGVGDHGGGPSHDDVQALQALIRERPDLKIVHSTPEAYFAELAASGAKLPRHDRDLNPWAVGCYTSQVRIKQLHRRLENDLYSLEKMASAAWLAGLMAYPAEEMRPALRDLLLCEFHDILPGSSQQQVEEMSLRVLSHGLEIVSRLKARAFFALAAGQPTARAGEIPIMVYNPHPFPVRTTVECEFQLADQNWQDAFTLPTVYQGRKALPSQPEKELSNLNLDWRKRVVFDAVLQPSQMNRFDCKLQSLPAKPAPGDYLQGEALVVKTDDLEVHVSTQTGLLDSVRVGGAEVVGPGAGEPLVMQDNEDPWGMRVHGFNTLTGRFKLLSPAAAARLAGVHAKSLAPVRVVEDGAVRVVIEALLGYRNSFICQRYKIPKAGTEVEIETRVQWAEKDQMVKLQVPCRVGGRRDAPTPAGSGTHPPARFVGQTAFGAYALPDSGDEAVSQKWVAVVGDEQALTCINDGTYGSSYADGLLRLTLLRSAAYSGHPIGDREIVPQDRFTPRLDQGERLFRFWLNAGPTQERLAAVDREALVHNERPMALSFFPSGAGDKPGPCALLSDEAVQVTALKRSEDGRRLIVRLFEPTGQKRTTTLSLPALGLKARLRFTPFEAKTLAVDPKSGFFSSVNLMEEEP
ncbi:glycosyl hydrolase-related protein [bacterium]|nr:glycosyl hydrolase-related protein [bacterium]